MANIKSAIKRVEVAERNRVRNKTWRSAIRTVRNTVEETAKLTDVEKANEALKQAYKTIDQAVSKGILHKNSAARKKSKLALGLAKMGSNAGQPTKTAAKSKSKPASTKAKAAAKATKSKKTSK